MDGRVGTLETSRITININMCFPGLMWPRQVLDLASLCQDPEDPDGLEKLEAVTQVSGDSCQEEQEQIRYIYIYMNSDVFATAARSFILLRKHQAVSFNSKGSFYHVLCSTMGSTPLPCTFSMCLESL